MSRRKHQIEAFFQQGRQLHAAGRLPEAEQVYRQILAVAPRHADSLHMLGVLAMQVGQPKGALQCIDQALAVQPDVAIFHVNRAAALLALGDAAAAVEGCRTALRHKRNCAEAFQVLGHALADLGRPEEAVAAYQDALKHGPNLPDLHNNLGLALRRAGRAEDAAAALRQAVARAPQDELAHSNLAGVLKELGELDAAEQHYRTALARRPDDAMLRFNLAVVLLLAGRWDAGWDAYEARFGAGVSRLPALPQPRWTGEKLAGRTLLVRAEQGFGDMFQFCRYLPAITGGRVVLEVHQPLRRLMASLHGPDAVIGVDDARPAFDLQIPLLSLPRLFPPPDPTPYLQAEPALVADWRERIGAEGFRIGIAWQGNPSSEAEFGRSVPLRHFAPLAALPGVRLISLQQRHGTEQLAEVPFADRIETPALDAGGDAFVDTAAVMQSLDLIVTSDTAIPHLAGALGRPTWVALKHVPDWRWMLGRPDSPWYPTMRLFRQPSRGNWDAVFADIAQAVRSRTG